MISLKIKIFTSYLLKLTKILIIFFIFPIFQVKILNFKEIKSHFCGLKRIKNPTIIYFYLSQNLRNFQNNFMNLKISKLFFFLRVTLHFLCVMTIDPTQIGCLIDFSSAILFLSSYNEIKMKKNSI
jgi:hypothetical protein